VLEVIHTCVRAQSLTPYFIFLIDPLDPLGLLSHTSYGLGTFLQVVILSYQFVITDDSAGPIALLSHYAYSHGLRDTQSHFSFRIDSLTTLTHPQSSFIFYPFLLTRLLRLSKVFYI
jgi:hypothetical protein